MSPVHECYREEGVYDLREALYLLSQNPPFKFVRIESIQIPKGAAPVLLMVFQDENITKARLQYIQGDHGNVDLTKLKVLASEVENYLKSQEDYCI
jgi:hypothetical protein